MHFHPDTLRQINADRQQSMLAAAAAERLAGSPGTRTRLAQFLRRTADRIDAATAPCGPQLGRRARRTRLAPHTSPKGRPRNERHDFPCTETADENDIPRGAEPMYLRRLLASLTAVVAAGSAVAALPAASDTKPPRIVAAAMQDTDRDGRADRLRLSYSERVRHPRDRDGRYPFRVAGYAIQSVGAASGKTVVLALAEKATIDAAARPAIRYRRTRATPVVDPTRNQAVAQVFGATRAHGNRPAPPPPPPPPGPLDRDGDGALDAVDCGPAIRRSSRAHLTCRTWRSSTPTATASTAPKQTRSSPRRSGKTPIPAPRRHRNARSTPPSRQRSASGSTSSPQPATTRG